MHNWYYWVYTYSPAEVQEMCVKDAAWQKFRLSLKGIPTTEKLEKLSHYVRAHSGVTIDGESRFWLIHDRKTQVRVSNYINALKRGGQLDMDLKVQR